MEEPTIEPLAPLTNEQRAQAANRGHIEDAVNALAEVTVKSQQAIEQRLDSKIDESERHILSAMDTKIEQSKREILAAFESVSKDIGDAKADELDGLKNNVNKVHRRLVPLEERAGIPLPDSQPYPDSI